MAAILSFVAPGAGQAWTGHPVRGLLLLAPLLTLAVASGAILASQGTARAIGLALQPQVLLGFVALNLVVGAWRVFATIDAYRLARRRWPSDSGRTGRVVSVVVLVALVTVILATHTGLGYVGYQAYDTMTTVFATPQPEPMPTPIATAQPTSAGLTATPRPPWSPTPAPSVAPRTWYSDGRLDILLMGLDEGPGRYSLRPDALILLSVDVATGRAALFGIPRYLQNVPLPPRSVNAFACQCFPDYLNSLFRYAEDHPVWFSGPDRERGLRATEEAVGALVGLELDGRIVINFSGFMRLIDALGGLTIYVPEPVYDARYPRPDGTGNMEISFAAGAQWMDGFHALAYARTRHQDSDYARIWRQEAVLLALRRQINPCRVITRLPELLRAAGTAMSTNLPVEQLPELLELAARVRADTVARYQFAAPTIPRILDADAIARVRAMVRDPFPAPDLPGPRPSGAPTPLPQPTPPSAC